jgi:predicted N-formylglutamate amidohydrolase
MLDSVVVTCEHGGNRVPRRYAPLFRGWEQRLATHRGMDFGALLMAREISRAFGAPLVASSVTRLLIDLNRSVGHREVHSRASRRTLPEERERIVRRYYLPYRTKVEDLVATVIKRGRRVIHISSHSFTPRLHGEVRSADVGLLYDPRRPAERGLAARWRTAFQKAAPELRVRRNYPYLGKLDGLTSHLRRRHSPEAYVGIELELNQSMIVGTKSRWTRLRANVVESLRSTVAPSPWPNGYRIHLFGPNPQ